MPRPTWTLSDVGAIAESGRWSVAIDPTRPQLGMALSRREPSANATPVGKGFSVKPATAHAMVAEEAYLRGADLVVRFDQTEQDAFAFQLNYRLLDTTSADSAGPLGIELWASVQTDNLDSEPVLVVGSDFPEAAPWTVYSHEQILAGDAGQASGEAGCRPAALIAQLAEATCVWLVEPSDQRHAELLPERPEDTQRRLALFGHFMEKGVIRRARLRLLLLEEQLTGEELRKHYLEFAESPLPLTA